MSDFIHVLVNLPLIVLVLLKITLVLGLGWMVHFFLIHRNPHWRVLLWRCVIVGLFLVPVLLPLKHVQIRVASSPELPAVSWPDSISEESTKDDVTPVSNTLFAEPAQMRKSAMRLFPTKAAATYTYKSKKPGEPEVKRLTTTRREIRVNPDFDSTAFQIVIPEGKIVEDYGANVTYKWVYGELQVIEGEPLPLTGQALPELKDFGIHLVPHYIDDKVILVCLFDMDQRPSRNFLRRLSEQAWELKAKDVVIVAAQASKMDFYTLNDWVKKNNIPFPTGMIQGDETHTRFTWGVKSLPWLIMTDKNHIVRAEGLSLSELDGMLTTDDK